MSQCLIPIKPIRRLHEPLLTCLPVIVLHRRRRYPDSTHPPSSHSCGLRNFRRIPCCTFRNSQAFLIPFSPLLAGANPAGRAIQCGDAASALAFCVERSITLHRNSRQAGHRKRRPLLPCRCPRKHVENRQQTPRKCVAVRPRFRFVLGSGVIRSLRSNAARYSTSGCRSFCPFPLKRNWLSAAASLAGSWPHILKLVGMPCSRSLENHVTAGTSSLIAFCRVHHSRLISQKFLLVAAGRRTGVDRNVPCVVATSALVLPGSYSAHGMPGSSSAALQLLQHVAAVAGVAAQMHAGPHAVFLLGVILSRSMRGPSPQFFE